MSNRRDFIKGIGKLAAVAGLAPLAVLCKPPKATPAVGKSSNDGDWAAATWDDMLKAIPQPDHDHRPDLSLNGGLPTSTPSLPPIEAWKLTFHDPEPGGQGRHEHIITFYFDQWDYDRRLTSLEAYAKMWHPTHRLERLAVLDDDNKELNVWVRIAGQLRPIGPMLRRGVPQPSRRIACEFDVDPPAEIERYMEERTQRPWQNYTTTYATVDKEVLIEKMRAAHDRMKFLPPVAKNASPPVTLKSPYGIDYWMVDDKVIVPKGGLTNFVDIPINCLSRRATGTYSIQKT